MQYHFHEVNAMERERRTDRTASSLGYRSQRGARGLRRLVARLMIALGRSLQTAGQRMVREVPTAPRA